jgi:hypothetical protein
MHFLPRLIEAWFSPVLSGITVTRQTPETFIRQSESLRFSLYLLKEEILVKTT